METTQHEPAADEQRPEAARASTSRRAWAMAAVCLVVTAGLLITGWIRAWSGYPARASVRHSETAMLNQVLAAARITGKHTLTWDDLPCATDRAHGDLSATLILDPVPAPGERTVLADASSISSRADAAGFDAR